MSEDGASQVDEEMSLKIEPKRNECSRLVILDWLLKHPLLFQSSCSTHCTTMYVVVDLTKSSDSRH